MSLKPSTLSYRKTRKQTEDIARKIEQEFQNDFGNIMTEAVLVTGNEKYLDSVKQLEAQKFNDNFGFHLDDQKTFQQNIHDLLEVFSKVDIDAYKE